MSDNDILLGIGLTVGLAVGCQILATRLRIPALILLLPAGFTVGALTDVVHPDELLGDTFSPVVSVSVALILYDAALGLDLRGLKRATRRVVVRLMALGVILTWGTVLGLGPMLFDVPVAVASMIGVILVVSGPTVVGPLLEHVRPSVRVRRVLMWEGTLIDPVGGILGAVAFHSIVSGGLRSGHFRFGSFLAGIAVGLVGGAVGVALLWFALRWLRLGETLGTLAQLATVVVVAAGCDIAFDDTGLIAAIVTGLTVANLPRFDMPARRPFFETLVQLIIGLLFLTISATVTPESLVPVLLPTLVLVALLVAVVRPLATVVSCARTDLSLPERAFVGWMAPRGIVAASTATTFSGSLVSAGLRGADKILPVVFLVIVGTVVVYGLTARPLSVRLGVAGPTRARPLLVGGAPWAVDLARALHGAGVDVLMWAGLAEERARVEEAGIESAAGELMTTATDPQAVLEGVTAVYLLTDDDDFNALASVVMADSVDGPIYRVGPPPGSQGVVAPYTGGTTLFGPGLAREALVDRHGRGARFHVQPASAPRPPGHDALFLVYRDGRLEPVTDAQPGGAAPGDTLVLLGPAPPAG
ncbi:MULTISPECIES: sodium:proton antiporter [unclassified Streptomyces]|uniref:cation:proton antiporter n=1 Tax=unclassified Streptomyces TaxID=2593676 RepID=UPI001F04B63D|nr:MULTISPECIES: cation:proton antiporter [unclassified Streptomyces]MCH0563921.1 sodium:proton exchanger [Streptomyces sp. MUM 2J]MCH0570688.1 sodium:proton exchanger [Streptomyces sp. MUM 136J]